MTVNLLIDGSSAKAAIYTGDDDLPFAAPLSYQSRVLFHTDLPTVGIVSSYTITVTTTNLGVWPGTSPATSGREPIPLLAHGRGGVPYVEGVITTGTLLGGSPVFNQSQSNVTLAGSVPLGRYNFVHLGADGTYVYLTHLYLRVPGVELGYWSLTLRIHVTDLLL